MVDTKHIVNAVSTGISQGSADRGAKRLLEAVKTALGENYPAIMATPIGQRVEPLVIPAVVSIATQFLVELLHAKSGTKSSISALRDLVNSGGAVDAVCTNIARTIKVENIANSAMTHAVADLTSSELGSLMSTIEGFVDTVLDDTPATVATVETPKV